jgi:alpha-glucosidase
MVAVFRFHGQHLENLLALASVDAHLPQPKWFGRYSVEAEENDPHSPLSIYRSSCAS